MGKMRKARMFLQSRSFGMGLTAFSLVVVVVAAGMFLASGIPVWSARGQQVAASSDAVSLEHASLDTNAGAEAGESAEENQGEDEGDANLSSMGSVIGFGTHGGYAPATGASASGQNNDNYASGAGSEGASGTQDAGNGADTTEPRQEDIMHEYYGMLGQQALEANSQWANSLWNDWHSCPAGFLTPEHYYSRAEYKNWGGAARARYDCNETIEEANRFFDGEEFLPPSSLNPENAANAKKLYGLVTIMWEEVKKAAELLDTFCDTWAACPDVRNCPECFLSLAAPHVCWYEDRGEKAWTIDYLMNVRETFDAFCKQEQEIWDSFFREQS